MNILKVFRMYISKAVVKAQSSQSLSPGFGSPSSEHPSADFRRQVLGDVHNEPDEAVSPYTTSKDLAFQFIFLKQIHSKHLNVSFMLNTCWFQSSYLTLPEQPQGLDGLLGSND